jgi:hypothetical protein
VTGGAGVEVPAINFVVARPIAEEDVGAQLVEVEKSDGGWRGRGVQLNAPVYEEQSRLVTLLCLRDMCLTTALRLLAALGLVTGLAVVLANVVAGSLALAVGTVRSATTRLGNLVPLARPTLAAARRT